MSTLPDCLLPSTISSPCSAVFSLPWLDCSLYESGPMCLLPHGNQEHPGFQVYCQGLVWHQKASSLSQIWTDAEQGPREQKRSQLGLKWQEFASGRGLACDMKGDRASGGEVSTAAAQSPPHAQTCCFRWPFTHWFIHSFIYSCNIYWSLNLVTG